MILLVLIFAPAVLAFIFIAIRVQPSLPLLNNDVDVCVHVLSHAY